MCNQKPGNHINSKRMVYPSTPCLSEILFSWCLMNRTCHPSCSDHCLTLQFYHAGGMNFTYTGTEWFSSRDNPSRSGFLTHVHIVISPKCSSILVMWGFPVICTSITLPIPLARGFREYCHDPKVSSSQFILMPTSLTLRFRITTRKFLCSHDAMHPMSNTGSQKCFLIKSVQLEGTFCWLIQSSASMRSHSYHFGRYMFLDSTSCCKRASIKYLGAGVSLSAFHFSSSRRKSSGNSSSCKKRSHSCKYDKMQLVKIYGISHNLV